MSNQHEQTSAQAASLLLQQVYAPVFFAKLASDYGIQPKNDEEAQLLLEVAAKLRDRYNADGGDAAFGVRDELHAVKQAADAVTSDSDSQEAEEDYYFRKAAEALAEDDLIGPASLLV